MYWSRKLPFWLGLIALLQAGTGVFGGPLGVPALDVPTDDPAYFARGLGVSVTLLVALWLGKPSVFLAGFATAAVRDAGDLVAQWTGPAPYPEGLLISGASLAINLLCLRKTRSALRKKAASR